MTRVWAIFGFLLVTAAFSAAVWLYSFAHSLSQLEQRGTSDLTLATNSLTRELASYRQLAVSLAGDPRLRFAEVPSEALGSILARVTDFSGALDMVLIDRGVGHVTSATGAGAAPWVGAPFVTRAFQGAVGRMHEFNEAYGRRVFHYAVPVFRGRAPVERVLVILIDLERIEADFRGGGPAVLMSDRAGRIIFSNRSELILRDRSEFLTGAPVAQDSVLARWAMRLAGVELWYISGERYLPARAVHIERDLPVIGMRGEGLIDAAPAFRTAWLQAAVAAIASLFFGAVIFFIAWQRLALARANEVLERRVAERTGELSATNAALREEVAERREAEAALKRAQDALIQSEKLSALGKMSAGISHELNQPLMAIRSFSENAEKFLERGNTAAVASNLSRVADLAQRMGRIIRNLRAFARQEGERVTDVDLVQAVRAALDLAEARLAQEGVELALDLPADPVWVRGGEVRLQQVALNLITNATDAMEGSEAPRLEIAIEEGRPVALIVRDNGPGLSEPDKLFEPFYTTKSIGEAEGLGLGLSISYGLVQSFGGQIFGANRPDGGAEFRVELNAVAKEAAE